MNYTTRVCICPYCGTDLDDEGLSFWCPSCRDMVPWAAVIPPGTIDEPDRLADDDDC